MCMKNIIDIFLYVLNLSTHKLVCHETRQRKYFPGNIDSYLHKFSHTVNASKNQKSVEQLFYVKEILVDKNDSIYTVSF